MVDHYEHDSAAYAVPWRASFGGLLVNLYGLIAGSLDFFKWIVMENHSELLKHRGLLLFPSFRILSVRVVACINLSVFVLASRISVSLKHLRCFLRFLLETPVSLGMLNLEVKNGKIRFVHLHNYPTFSFLE